MTFKEFKDIYRNIETLEEKKKFIQERLTSLANFSDQRKIGLNLTSFFADFISPNMIIMSNSNAIYGGLLVDDMNVYSDFLDYIDNDVDKFLTSEPQTITYIQDYLYQYFGYFSGSWDDREDVYFGRNVSITEFKNQNLSQCAEKCALAHNLLLFLGFQSELVFGKLKGSHVFIVFKPKNKNFWILYDPENPVRYVNSETGQKDLAIGVSLMSQEEYIDLKNAKPYLFHYDLVKKLYKKGTEFQELSRVYNVEKINELTDFNGLAPHSR